MSNSSATSRPAVTPWPVWLAVIATLLASSWLTSCARTKTVAVQIPVMIPSGVQLRDPPPKMGVHVVLGDEGCPAPFAACLMPEDAAALAVQIANARVWMREAWASCRDNPEGSFGP